MRSMIPFLLVVRFRCAKVLSIALTAAACSPGISAPAPAPTQDAGSTQHLDRLVTTLREVTGVPGLSVSIAGPTGEVETSVAGVASLETGSPVTPATRFRLASVSKAVTAVGLASLADAGVIGLDQPARKMLPELRGPIGTVTPRQLAGHLAGVRHYEPGDTALDHRHFASLRDAVEVFADDPLVEAPGERYVYSTFGYTLLGALMEAAADRRFPQILQAEITNPLGIETPAPEVALRPSPDFTSFYDPGAAGPVPSPAVDPSYKVPGGGMVATSGDLARFGRAVLDGRLAAGPAGEALFQPLRDAAGDETGVGLGWRVGRDPLGSRVWHHEGSMSGARSAILIYPDQDMLVTILSNLATTPFFVFETAAALAAAHLAERTGGCVAEISGDWAGTMTMDGAPTAARLTVARAGAAFRGEAAIEPLPLPVATALPVVDGWCDGDDAVLLFGLGPNWGFIPVRLSAQEDGLSGRTELQGGHELRLELTRD